MANPFADLTPKQPGAILRAQPGAASDDPFSDLTPQNAVGGDPFADLVPGAQKSQSETDFLDRVSGIVTEIFGGQRPIQAGAPVPPFIPPAQRGAELGAQFGARASEFLGSQGAAPPSLEPIARNTSEGRPLLRNNQGGVSSELSITVTDPRLNGGRATNIPSIFGGKIVSQDEAIRRVVEAGGKDPETGRAVLSFDTIEGAEAAARQRSDQLGAAPPPIPEVQTPRLTERQSGLGAFGRAIPRGALDTTATMIAPFELQARRGENTLRQFDARIRRAGTLGEDEFRQLENDIFRSPMLSETEKVILNNRAFDIRSGKVDPAAVPDSQGLRETIRAEDFASARTGIKGFGERTFPITPEREGELPTQIGRGIGSTLPFVLSRLVPGGVLLVGTEATLIGMGEAIERAAQEGASDEEQAKAALLGAVPGITDLAPIEALFRKGPRIARAKGVKGALLNIFAKLVLQGAVEGTQEAAQEFLQNSIARLRNGETELQANVGKSGFIGFIVGMIFGAGGGAVSEVVSATRSSPRQDRRGERVEPTVSPPGPPVETASVPAPPKPALVEPSAPVAAAGATPFDDLIPEARPTAPESQPPARTVAQDGLGVGADVTVTFEDGEQATGRITETQEFEDGSRAVRVENDAGVVFDGTTDEAQISALTPQPSAPQPTKPIQPKRATPAPTTPVTQPVATTQLESVDPDTIAVDAKRFQFKAGADQAGINQRLVGVETFDPRLAGTVLVFEQQDGQRFIVDGHQRLALARRAKSAGQPNAALNAFVLREAEGITDREARAIAAVKNIAEGTGTAVDAAKVLRDAGQAQLPPLPPQSALVRDARALARLSEESFGVVVNEVVPARFGTIVGRLASDPETQFAALSALSAFEPSNAAQAELIVREVLETGVELSTQQTLFGEEVVADNLIGERARVLDAALKQLRRDRTTFRTLVDRESAIAGAGNVLAREANIGRLSEDERLIAATTKLATRKGPVSDALSEAARVVKAGQPINRAVKQFLQAVRTAAQQNFGEGVARGGGTPEGVGQAVDQSAADPFADLIPEQAQEDSAESEREPPLLPPGTFTAGIDPTVAARIIRKDLRAISRAVGRATTGFRERLLGSTALSSGQIAVEPSSDMLDTDITPFRRIFATPLSATKRHPELQGLIMRGMEADVSQSNFISRLNREYNAIKRPLSTEEFSQVGDLLLVGDSQGVEYSRSELLSEQQVTPKVADAYLAMRRLLEKLGRLVDQHERAMRPAWRARKFSLLRRMARIRVMSDPAFQKLYGQRSRLRVKLKRGDGNPETIAGQLESLEERLNDIREESAEYKRLLDEVDQIDNKLQRTSVRTRSGYFPHKFFGTWRLFRQVGEGEEAQWEHIAGKDGFFDDRASAIKAARAFAQEHLGARLRVAPVTFTFPNREATQLSDAAYWRFAARLEKTLGVEGEELRELMSGVARRRFRRRIAGFSKFRAGVRGYSKNVDRVMVAHIGSVVRYTTMDRLKADAINTMERLGLSDGRASNQDNPSLAAFMQGWWRDMNGEKQTLERSIDRVLKTDSVWSRPLALGLETGTVAFFATGGLTGNPFIGGLVGGYVGWRFYRGVKKGGEFPTRAITAGALTDMAHLKLGAFFNISSAVVNLSQTIVNTWPVLGTKWTTVGLEKLAVAAKSAAVGRPNNDWKLLLKNDIATRFRFTETSPNLFEREGKLAFLSLFAFNSAEKFNRAVAFLGAFHRAQAAGANQATAVKSAIGIGVRSPGMLRTQFLYSNANKPEILRNVLARVPLQFKNFVAQEIAFAFNLRGAEIPRFMVSLTLMAGTLGWAGLGLLDWITEMFTDFSPIRWVKERALEAQSEGDLTSSVGTFLAWGLPGLLGTDLSTRIGQGDKFLPLELRDWKGPWWSTIEKAAVLGETNATLVDQLRNLSAGLGAPLKSLEAAGNGLPLFETLARDRQQFFEALGDGEARLTNPWKNGNLEFEPTTGELALKGLGFTPIRESQLRAAGDITRAREREAKEVTRKTVNQIVDALLLVRDRARQNEIVREALQEAKDAGVTINRRQINTAVQNRLRSRGERTVRGVRRELRPDVNRLFESAR